MFSFAEKTITRSKKRFQRLRTSIKHQGTINKVFQDVKRSFTDEPLMTAFGGLMKTPTGLKTFKGWSSCASWHALGIGVVAIQQGQTLNVCYT